jgi:uridine phosphorylase
LEKNEAYKAPHLAVGLGVVRPVVLCCGDPFRSKIIAEMCDTHKEVAHNREYRMFNVTFEGADMTVVSHGIGGPGAAICFEELIKLGATTIIRLGTCGSLKPTEIKQGQLVVSTSACREDGHSSWMVPAGFPAVADPRVSLALFDQAKSLGYSVQMGVTLTSGNFYPGPAMPSTLQVNADAGALTVEMENATLFCVGSVRGIRTGAIATVDGSPFNWEDGDYDPHGKTVAEGKTKMIMTGLKVGSKIAAEGVTNVKS